MSRFPARSPFAVSCPFLRYFVGYKAEYEEEGIPWSHVDFSDNAEVLGLVESRMGIIAVLNEECVRPRGGDLSFVSKVRDVWTDGGGGRVGLTAGPRKQGSQLAL